MAKPAPKPPLIPFVIVDDHRAVADIMACALELRSPVRCVARFNTIADAQVGLLQHRPQVVILDWRLGEESSAGLIRALKPQLPETRWLLFTAWPTVPVLREAIPAGIHGCVSKSTDYEELAQALREVVNGGSYFCSESLRALGQGMMGNGTGAHLTETERNILRHVAQGLEPKEISAAMNLSTKTIHNYLVNVRQKLGLGSMVDLAKYAVQQGIAPPS